VTEPLNIERILEFIGYDEDPANVVEITVGVGYLELHRLDGTVRYFKTIHRPDGSIKLTGQDITWVMEWEILMGGKG